MCLCVHPSIMLSIYLSIYLSIDLAIYLSIHLSINSHKIFAVGFATLSINCCLVPQMLMVTGVGGVGLPSWSRSSCLDAWLPQACQKHKQVQGSESCSNKALSQTYKKQNLGKLTETSPTKSTKPLLVPISFCKPVHSTLEEPVKNE